MYLSKIKLSDNADAGDVHRLICANGYDHHKLLWNFFSDDAERKRDFLFRRDDARGRPIFYTVSARPPKQFTDALSVAVKEYRPLLHEGEHLSFLLRVNPIRSRRNAAGKQERHDVIMEARQKLKTQNIPREQWTLLPDLVQEEGSAWLSARAERCGFELKQVRADGYMQHRYFKRGVDKQIAISTIELSGVVRVIDVDLFLNALYGGIGHSKGFGCGLMLIRRA